MAPRTGPQGVTNEDVARRAGVTYVYAPATNQPTTIDPAMLNAYLIGGQAPGYGMKYGGFPTATYGEAAITGQAYGIADLARQAAEQAQAEQAQIEDQLTQDYMANRAAQAAKYRYAPSAALYFYTPPKPDANAAQRLVARGRLLNALQAERESRVGELERQQAPLVAKAQRDVASLPSAQLSEALGVFTPSQLAQQIAVSRYGYDPMLAAGLFGEGVNTAYANQQEAARQAQMQAMGYNIGLSNDEILASQMSPEEFEQYQLAKAGRALETATTDTQAVDAELFNVYGTTPSDENERSIMQSVEFKNAFENGLQQLQQIEAISPAAGASAVARDYLENNPGQTQVAILLEDLLSRYSFLVKPLIPVDIPSL